MYIKGFNRPVYMTDLIDAAEEYRSAKAVGTEEAGVWYSKRLVSSWPVSSGPLMPIVHPDWCSSIWEFVEAEH